jgi:hypothetical protein
VAYFIDQADLVKAEDGSLDAEATLNQERGDVANYTDDAGNLIGGTYGAFVAAPINAALAPFIQGRVDDNRVESKRYEAFRLSGADNQSKVRLRFTHAGTDSWYWGIDDFGIYAGSGPVTAPALSARISVDRFVIEWPSAASGFVLESATSPTSSGWSPVPGISGNSASLPIADSERFFRLRKP